MIQTAIISLVFKLFIVWFSLQKWKERKETQRLRFRMALADAVNVNTRDFK